MKLAVIGHSHVVSLLDALGGWRERPPASAGNATPAFKAFNASDLQGLRELGQRSLHGFTLEVTAVVVGNDAKKGAEWSDADSRRVAASRWLLDAYAAIKGIPVIVCALRGDELYSTMYESPAPYQIAGAGVDYRPGIPPVDSQAIIDVASRRVWKKVAPYLLPLGAACPGSKFIVVPPPPPVRNLSKLTLAEKNATPARAEIRKFWHAAQVAAYERHFGASARVMKPPREALDGEGYLKPELAEGLAHANAAYGQMVWGEILRTMFFGASSKPSGVSL